MQRIIWIVGIATGLAFAAPSGETAHADSGAVRSTVWTTRACDSSYTRTTTTDRPAVHADAVAGAANTPPLPCADTGLPAAAVRHNHVDTAPAHVPFAAHTAASALQSSGNEAQDRCHNDGPVESRGATHMSGEQRLLPVGSAQPNEAMSQEPAPDTQLPILTTDPNTAALARQHLGHVDGGYEQPSEQAHRSKSAPLDGDAPEASPVPAPTTRVPRVHHVRVDLGMEQALPETGITFAGHSEGLLFVLGLFSLVAGVVLTRCCRQTSVPTPATPPVLPAEQVDTVAAVLPISRRSTTVREAGARPQLPVPSEAPTSGQARYRVCLPDAWSPLAVRQGLPSPTSTPPPQGKRGRLRRRQAWIAAGGVLTWPLRCLSINPPAQRYPRRCTEPPGCWWVGSNFVPI